MEIYDINELEKDILMLKEKRRDIEIKSIGRTRGRNEIYLLKKGSGAPKMFINAAHHSLEWITSAVLMRFFERVEGFLGTLFIVPMVNPDGISLAWHENSKEWQANSRGVDLNHNYDAGFYEYQKFGFTYPAPTKYQGPYPFSERETRIVSSLCRRENFDRALALHTQGEEIYMDFKSYVPKGAREIAKKMAKASGYEIKTPVGTAVYGGFKDWFIKEFDRPGFTAELGKGKNPLKDFREVYKSAEPLLESFVKNI